MFFTAILITAYAFASDGNVRVKIFPHNSRHTAPQGIENPQRFRLSSPAGCARYAAGGTSARDPKAEPLETSRRFAFDAATFEGPAWIECAQAATLEREGGTSARYAGSFFVKKITPGQGTPYLTVVNVLPLEQYLRAVVPAEMSAVWPMEALKAQAVAARTYALYELAGDENNLDPRIDAEASGAELDDTVFFQAYEGEGRRTRQTDEAVDETRGLTLTSGGHLLKAYFHSDSGGRTATCAAAFGTPLPYCVESVDEARTPTTTWTARFKPRELSRRLAAAKLIPSVKEVVSVDAGNGSTRPTEVLVEFRGGGSKLLDPRELRFALGLKSAWFRFAREAGSFIVHGRGAGHGAGMSQWGARRLAEHREGFEQILKHYYTGARLTPVVELDAGIDEAGTQALAYYGSAAAEDLVTGLLPDQIYGLPALSGRQLATHGTNSAVGAQNTQL